MQQECVDCHEQFDVRTGAWHEVVGWIEQRPAQGLKGNSVHGKQFTGRVRCGSCGKLRAMGATVGQQSMFGEDG